VSFRSPLFVHPTLLSQEQVALNFLEGLGAHLALGPCKVEEVGRVNWLQKALGQGELHPIIEWAMRHFSMVNDRILNKIVKVMFRDFMGPWTNRH
jgi:hypothetical protein